MRVVALTADASLAVALTMMDGWEIIDVRDLDDLARFAPTASAILVGVGGTDAGLGLIEQLSSRGVSAPTVVVGDVEPERSSLTVVVTRPFSLEDIRAAVEKAVASAPPAAGPGDPVAGSDDVKPAARTEVPRTVDIPRRFGPRDKGERTPEDQHAAEDELERTPSAPTETIEALDEPSREPILSLDPVEIEPAVEPHDVPETTRAPEQTADDRPPLRLPETDPIPSEWPARAPDPEPTRPEPVEPRAPVREDAPAQDRPARAPAPIRPEPAVARAETSRPKRRFGRRPPPPVVELASKLPAEVRMKAVVIAAKEIGQLLQELPMLADRRKMAAALLAEAVSQFSPDTAMVLVRNPGGFEVFAEKGLSSTERRMTVPLDQALVLELATNGEAMHVAPVDLARGLVLGIPGARSEALIAAPIILDGSCEAVVVLCRSAFQEAELEALDDLAREGAAGFAVAQALDRLRG